MNRLYAVSDIHGNITAFKEALLKSNLVDNAYNWTATDSTLVVCGDMIDRGDDSKGVVDLIIKMRSQAPEFNSKVVALKGNHEVMMLRGLDRSAPEASKSWLMNGGFETLASYALGISRSHYEVANKILGLHGDFYRHLLDFYVEGDTLFVHAGLDPRKTLNDIGSSSNIDHLWLRDEFFRGAHPATFLRSNYGVSRVVFGHTSSIELKSYFNDTYLCIDTGSMVLGSAGRVTIVKLLPDLDYQIMGQGK